MPPTNCSYLNIKGVTIKFSELAMLPNPLQGLLIAPKPGTSLTIGVSYCWELLGVYDRKELEIFR